MNLINGTHHSCERREHAFMVLREYLIIFHRKHTIMFMIIYMLRKTLNGINDLIVYKFVFDNDVE